MTVTLETGYQPQAASAAFTRIADGVDPYVAFGDFLDDWRRTPRDQRFELVRAPIEVRPRGQKTLRWAAMFAAAIDQLCADDAVAPPGWVGRDIHRLEDPWFLIEGTAIRAWLLVTTPVPFKVRNIFTGDTVLQRT